MLPERVMPSAADLPRAFPPSGSGRIGAIRSHLGQFRHRRLRVLATDLGRGEQAQAVLQINPPIVHSLQPPAMPREEEVPEAERGIRSPTDIMREEIVQSRG
jgi:hypothetical protein